MLVDTPKKAKKLKKVLGMFGENHTGEAIGNGHYNGVKLFDDTWCAIKTEIEVDNESKVSIKELRNILAIEHLKEGDVVALGYGKSVEYLGVFKSFNNGYFEVKRYLSLNSGSGILMTDAGCIKNFIRYATDEEKELLEPADKFAELKEAHRNGRVVQFEKDGSWYNVLGYEPTFDIHTNYRIKPEEKPKVGDVCKFWDEDENAFVVAIYAELREDNQWDDTSFTHPHGVRVAGNYYTRFFKNAKPLNPQQVQELLFGKDLSCPQ